MIYPPQSSMSPNLFQKPVKSDLKTVVNIRVHEKGKSFDYEVCASDSIIRVFSRSVPVDVCEYKRNLYNGLSLAFAAYLRIAD